jgi:hypothetical protein
LRCLASRDDLAGFRYRAITAGINDVTVGKRSEAVSASVEAIVIGAMLLRRFIFHRC